MFCYKVGYTPGPIGNPIKYQPIINNIHTAPIIKQYGIIYDIALFILIAFFSLFYIFIYPKYITKYANNGLIPLVIESPALNIN